METAMKQDSVSGEKQKENFVFPKISVKTQFVPCVTNL
jgi:hypothetical protein